MTGQVLYRCYGSMGASVYVILADRFIGTGLDLRFVFDILLLFKVCTLLLSFQLIWNFISFHLFCENIL